MTVVTARQSLLEQLQVAFQAIGKGPVLLHTDIVRVGVIDSLKTREAMCADYETVISESLGDRSLLIPTFNYDYCRDGIYDVQNSPSQVGALTDYYRQKYWQQRTRTPVFHFCILNNREFGLGAIENCFGEQSTFAELVRQDGLVAFLGADFSCTTFIHHVEERCNVEYRYHKVFPGIIIDGITRTPVKLVYRVRPLEPPNAVVYDWARLQSDLEHEGILTSFQAGHGLLRIYRARDLLDYWTKRIGESPRYLLNAHLARRTFI